MSNVFRDIYPFVPVAQRWQPGQKLSPSLLNFHDCLCYMAFYFSTVRFESIPNSLFADLRQMSADAVERGRMEAAELKWIGYKRGYRNTYTYWFLDPSGREFVPMCVPGAIPPKPSWRYRSNYWQQHLAKRHKTTVVRRQEFDHLTSGDCLISDRDLRQTPDAHIRQVPANKRLATRCEPLENLNLSEEVGISEDAPVRSAHGLEPKCISPTWDELGSDRAQNQIFEGNARTSPQVGEVVLFSKDISIVSRGRTQEGLLKDIQDDKQAMSVIGAFSRCFGAKIVEICDTKVSQEQS